MEAATAERPKTNDEEQQLEDGDEVVQLSIEGDGDLSLTVGGKNADIATISFAGGEITMPKGQFKKGQRVAVLLVGPIAEVHAIDIRDPKTKDVVKVKRKHVLKPDDVRRVALETVEDPR